MFNYSLLTKVGAGVVSSGVVIGGGFGIASYMGAFSTLPTLYVVVETKENADSEQSTSTSSNYSCKLTSNEEVSDDNCSLTKLDLSSFVKKQASFKDLIKKEETTFSTSDLVAGNIFKLKANKKIIDAIDWTSEKTIDLLNKRNKTTKYAVLKPLFVVKENAVAETKTPYWVAKVNGFKDSSGNVQSSMTSVAKGSVTFTCPFYSETQTNKDCAVNNFIASGGATATLSENEFSWSTSGNVTNIENQKHYIFKSTSPEKIISSSYTTSVEKDVEANADMTGASSGNARKIKITDLQPAIIIEAKDKNFIVLLK